MKKLFFSLATVLVIGISLIATIIIDFVVGVGRKIGDSVSGYMANQGLMLSLVTLRAPYGGYSAGQTVGLNASTEAALIASGQASVGVTVTPGALTTNQRAGVCAVAVGTSSVVITNPNITKQSRVSAHISQAAADATALYVARIVAADGMLTIHVNANATAATQIDWAVLYDGSLNTPS